MYPKELENFKRLNAEIFLTFARWMLVQTSWDDGVLVKGCTELLGSPSSQGLLFLSSLHLRHLFSPLAVSMVLKSALSLCSAWALAWEQRDSPPPYTSTPSLSATICPTLASHHSFPPSKRINTPLSLSAGTLAHKPATAAIPLRATHLSSSAMFYAL